MATPGCACLPPGRRIHHLTITAKDNAIQQGSATEKRGKPFWTIRAPKTPALPY